MPGKRTTMRKLRDVLRLRHAAGLSIRDISRSTKLSVEAAQPGPGPAPELAASRGPGLNRPGFAGDSIS